MHFPVTSLNVQTRANIFVPLIWIEGKTDRRTDEQVVYIPSNLLFSFMLFGFYCSDFPLFFFVPRQLGRHTRRKMNPALLSNSSNRIWWVQNLNGLLHRFQFLVEMSPYPPLWQHALCWKSKERLETICELCSPFKRFLISYNLFHDIQFMIHLGWVTHTNNMESNCEQFNLISLLHQPFNRSSIITNW